MQRAHARATTFFALLAFGSSAQALVRPAPELGVLPDYDIRRDAPAQASEAGLAPLSADGAGASASAADGLAQPSALQRAGLARLRSEVGARLEARFGGVAGLPKMLFNPGGALSAPRAGDAATIGRDFLRSHADLFGLAPAEIDALRVSKNFTTAGSGTRHLLFVQQVRGVDVYRGDLRLVLAADGRVLLASATDVQPQLDLDVIAPLGAEQAVYKAAGHIGRELTGEPRLVSSLGSRYLVFEVPGLSRPALVRPTVFPYARSGMIAWIVELWPAADVSAYELVVDGRAGRLLSRVNLTNFASNKGLVFDGPYPDTFAAGGAGVAQAERSFGYRWPSTLGWTNKAPYGDYQITTGNNVDATWNPARVDTIPVPSYVSTNYHADGGLLQEWLSPFTNGYESSGGSIPAAGADVDASVTNLFYWINYWHDYAHSLGFDEASGNFQRDNMTRGGCGTDHVFAFSGWGSVPTDGTGPSLNNATFQTPAEDPSACPPGTPRNGIMRMFLFTGPPTGPFAFRDATFDFDVVIHEFTHGVSTRLVGGPFAGCLGGLQSGGMGEGWSDWFPSSYLDSPVVGEYSTNDTLAGIRAFPMDANPRTYADLCSLGGCEVHNEGEIHASTLWDVRAVVGAAIADQLVMDSFKFMACSPSFIDARDALLLADDARYGGAHVCDIWEAYRARGMGFDALGADSDFRVPDFVFTAPRCSGQAHLRYDSHTTSDVAGGDGDGLFGIGETIDLNVVLENYDGASTATGVTATVTTTTPGITMVAGTQPYLDIANGAAAGPASPFRFRIDPGFVCGTRIDFSVSITWAPGVTRPETFLETGGFTRGAILASDNFEAAPVWVLSGSAGSSTAHNHTPTGASSVYTQATCYAGDNPAACGMPCDDICSAIVSPPFRVPTDTAASVGFWATYNIEYTWDGLWIEVSRDGGSTWQYVDTGVYPSTSPPAAEGCAPAMAVGSVNGPPDNSSLAPWAFFSASLEDYLGEFVMARVVHHTDPCVYFEGGYVDDVEVAVANCTAAPFVKLFVVDQAVDDGVVACTDGDGNPDPGERIDWRVTIQNIGTAPATSVMGTISSSNPNIIPVSAMIAFGTIPPGGTASGTFSYDVGMAAGCFEPASLDLRLTATGGYMAVESFDYELRSDAGTVSYFDNFDSGLPAWTPSLGPDGSASDWAIARLDCLPANASYWATGLGIVPAVCSSGEPDYSDDSDSVLTSGMIDLGGANQKLLSVRWESPGGLANSVVDGFTEISLDFDGSGTFTPIANVAGGLLTATSLDIQSNLAGTPVPPASTSRFVRARYRFRSRGPDPGATADSIGMWFDNWELVWQTCDRIACAPGILGPGRASTAGGPGAPAPVTNTLRVAKLASVLRVAWEAPLATSVRPPATRYRVFASGAGTEAYLDATDSDRDRDSSNLLYLGQPAPEASGLALFEVISENEAGLSELP